MQEKPDNEVGVLALARTVATDRSGMPTVAA